LIAPASALETKKHLPIVNYKLNLRRYSTGGQNVFSNDAPEIRRATGGVRKPPGGGSSIVF